MGRVVEMRYGVDDIRPDGDSDTDDTRVRIDDRIPPKLYLELGDDFRCHEVIIGSNADNYSGWELQIKRNAKGVAPRRSKIPLQR